MVSNRQANGKYQISAEDFDLEFLSTGTPSAYLYDPHVHGTPTNSEWFASDSPFAQLAFQPRLVQATPDCALVVPTSALPAARLPQLAPIAEAAVTNRFMVGGE